MILLIDTHESKKVRLAIIPAGKGRAVKKTFAIAQNENHKTVGLIASFLKNAGLKPENISKIIACSGPGSFNGIRVGMAVALALGFAWNVPVSPVPTDKLP